MPDGAITPAKPRPRVPGALAPLVQAIGEDAVFRLLEQRGGTQLYVPGHKLTPKRGLGKQLQLDADACRRLQDLLGNDRYRVPLCRQWRAAVYRSAGYTYTQIALKLGVSDVAVYAYLRDTGHTNSNQLALPL